MQLYFKNTDEKTVSGIIIVPDPEQPRGVSGKKYRSIDNSPAGISTFLATMKRKFPDATHCNFYGKHKGYFVGRIEME